MRTPSPPHPLLEGISQWPAQPGVYIMRDQSQRILYVGKAKSLRARIRSYFHSQDKLAAKTRVLMKKIMHVEFMVTSTELEALLLECNLIKKHRPRYNMRLKDDKNYPYVVLDFTHPFPQFRIARRVIPNPSFKYFGPFNSGVQEISRFLLKTFQIRDCSDSKFKNRSRPCLNYEIGTCTAPCVDYVDQTNYGKQVQEAILFLKGHKQELLRTLKNEMKTASDKQEYEQARIARDKIRSVEKMTEKQSAVWSDKQKDVDVLGYFEGEQELQWVVLFLRNGYLTGRRNERTALTLQAKEESVASFLEQFYTVSLVPDEIWVAEEFPGRDTLELFLQEQAKKPVKVLVKRGEKPIRLLGMAHENAKLLHQDRLQKKLHEVSGAEALQEALELPDAPYHIEGMDVSNIQGTSPAISCVHFAGERPLKSHYRLYYPKTVEGQDDFAMIYEAVGRRLKDTENPPPDLLMIDGGKGQLASAVKAIQESGLNVPVVSLAKERTVSSFSRKEIEKSEDRIFIPGRKNPLNLKATHPGLRLLQRVRDEAHRFCLTAHQRRRQKTALEESPLTLLPGIGQKSREKLLKYFGSLDLIKQAPIEELIKAGLNKRQAETLRSQNPLTEEE